MNILRKALANLYLDIISPDASTVFTDTFIFLFVFATIESCVSPAIPKPEKLPWKITFFYTFLAYLSLAITLTSFGLLQTGESNWITYAALIYGSFRVRKRMIANREMYSTKLKELEAQTNWSDEETGRNILMTYFRSRWYKWIPDLYPVNTIYEEVHSSLRPDYYTSKVKNYKLDYRGLFVGDDDEMTVLV